MTITNIINNGPIFTFTINSPICIVNAIRRIIISSIPTFVFETTPEEKNKLKIEINTSRFNNEIIKQRVSCIPIHISDLSTPVDTFEIHIDKQNDTENLINVTTNDIKLFDLNANTYISDDVANKMFPPNKMTGDYIIICRLRPRINDEIPGEHFKCKAKMSISTASVLGCYNVAHTCTFVYEKDIVNQNAVWDSIKNTIVEKDDTPETEALKKKNWMLGDGTKIVKPNIYNFKLETVGVFSNLEIIRKAIDLLISMFRKYMERNDYIITRPENIIKNGYDIQIEDDYTAGYILQYILYQNFYEKEKILSFVGFKKFHPHDSYSIIRLAFNSDDSNEETARSLIKRSSELIIKYLQDLDSKFI
jgi:DNA-directed RNA polymerase subunit L